MLHIPILRGGRPYRSIDTLRTPHYRTREPFVEISIANTGLIRRDLRNQSENREILSRFSSQELFAICSRAAVLFGEGTLPLGDTPQTAEDYIRQVSATTGLPHIMVRRNMQKIRGVMADMETVINGLTRNLDTRIFDDGYAGPMSYFPRGESLGVVLPNNSPGVHALWVPAFAMKTPLVLKPAAPSRGLRIASSSRSSPPARRPKSSATIRLNTPAATRSCASAVSASCSVT
jgi:hypothetical protein